MMIFASLYWFGCQKDSSPKQKTLMVYEDNDGDGIDSSEACNDNNAEVSPQNIEICDGLDNDCDEAIDEEVMITVYVDSGFLVTIDRRQS